MTAYGRLEVFFPDGMHKTFVLTEDNVSVGRQPGNAISLDTETISRYHLTITRQQAEITITDLDSANGTFVDGARLKHDEQHPLIGGEEILIGDLRLFYYSLDESPTRPNLPPVEEAVPVSADQASFHIEMDEPEIAVPPGAHTSAELRVLNRGSLSERFVVEVTGVPRQWVRIDRAEFDLRPEDPGFVQISFKPLRKPESAPGPYPVTVTVRQKNDPTQSLQCVVTLRVLPYSGFGMALEKRLLAPDQPFRVHLHNQGSADLPISLSSADPANALRVTLEPEQTVLKPDQRLVVNGRAALRKKRIFGTALRYAFDVRVQSGDSAHWTVAQRAYVTERPPMPGWAPYVLILGALALILLALGGFALLTRAPNPPTINQFSLQPPEVPAGQSLQAAWAADGAQSFTLSLNGVVVQTFGSEVASASVQTDGLDGLVRVGLLAENAGGEASAEATAVVTAPLAIEAFNASPTMLVRHVVMPITFAWSAPGAVSVRLLGTEALSATPVEDSLPPAGTVTLNSFVLSPETELLVTLIAVDGTGNAIQQSLALPVTDPLCTARSETNLYNAPSAGAQVVSTVPAGTPVVVDARNNDGTWLRIPAGGVRSWGEAADFECSDAFAISALQPDPTVPQIVPANAASATPAATSAPVAPAGSPTPGVLIQPGAPATPTESAGARG